MSFEIEAADLSANSLPSPHLVLTIRVGHHARPNSPRFAYVSAFPFAQLRVGNLYEPLRATVTRVVPAEIMGDQHFDIRIELEPSFDALERIEQARLGVRDGSVKLWLSAGLSVARFVACAAPGAPSSKVDVPGPACVLSSQRDLQELHHEIPRDKWLAHLSGLGFADVLVFELPRRIVGQQTREVTSAKRLLAEARRAYDAGDWDVVALRTFKALEELAPGNAGVPDRIAQRYFANAHQVVRDRLHEHLRTLTRLMHVGRHATQDAQGQLVDVSRAHAAFLLGAAELVVGWCAVLAP